VTTENSEQLARLWTKAHPTVAAYVGSVLPDLHQAEDVLQEVAVTLVRKFDQYDPQQPFVGWAIGIARNEVLKSRRTAVTDRHVFADDLLGRIAAGYQGMAEELDARRRALRECVGEVGGRARRALDLRYAQGLKPATVAERLGMTGGAVRVLLHRVRSALRDCIRRRLKELATT